MAVLIRLDCNQFPLLLFHFSRSKYAQVFETRWPEFLFPQARFQSPHFPWLNFLFHVCDPLFDWNPVYHKVGSARLDKVTFSPLARDCAFNLFQCTSLGHKSNCNE